MYLKEVDLRCRMLAFHGACGEPHSNVSRLSVSPVPLIPLDKESFVSITSHEENAIFIFEESRTLLFNQLVNADFFKQDPKEEP
jgi:hypothetical protein